MCIALSYFVCYVLKLMFEVVPLALKLVNFFFPCGVGFFNYFAFFTLVLKKTKPTTTLI